MDYVDYYQNSTIPSKMRLFQLLDEGLITAEWLAETLIGWIDEHDAERFLRVNELNEDHPNFEDNQ